LVCDSVVLENVKLAATKSQCELSLERKFDAETELLLSDPKGHQRCNLVGLLAKIP